MSCAVEDSDDSDSDSDSDDVSAAAASTGTGTGNSELDYLNAHLRAAAASTRKRKPSVRRPRATGLDHSRLSVLWAQVLTRNEPAASALAYIPSQRRLAVGIADGIASGDHSILMFDIDTLKCVIRTQAKVL